jgi:hypothetical protein
VLRKISLALVLMTMAGVASGGDKDKCVNLGFITICPPSSNPGPVRAPEIDPASALAGLTMLAGGLAVLRGRRRVTSKE